MIGLMESEVKHMSGQLVPETQRRYRVCWRGQWALMLSGHDTREQAQARCDEANTEAINLGISPLYEVVERSDGAAS